MTKETYRYLIDNAQKRLFAWRVNSLAFAGRVTLAQSVMAAFLTYTMQTTLLPKSICGKLEQLTRSFVWGRSFKARGWHTVNWERFCLPKRQGGIGFRRVYDFNRAMMMKLGWGLIEQPDAFWVRVLREKYKCGHNVLQMVNKTCNMLATWRGIVTIWNDVLNGIHWILGNGRRACFWVDVWLPSGQVLLKAFMADITDYQLLLPVAEFVNDRGEWVLDRLDGLLPAMVIS